MKALLAIDTSSGATGVALCVDGRVVARAVGVKARSHSENIFTRIDEVLGQAGVVRGSLTGIAVTRGPGSFTGLRVGLATAKGLSFGLGVPVAGVSTVKALAHPLFSSHRCVAAVIDAKKGQVYGAAYIDGTPVLPEAAWDPRSFAGEVAALAAGFTFVGSGIDAYGGEMASVLGGNISCAPEGLWAIDPGEVALLGLEEFAAGRLFDSLTLAPLYLRRSEAEETSP